jgi:adenosine kinase
MNIVLTGSIAFDYLMTFPGYFKDNILPDMIEKISLSFLVDSLTRRPGGIAANIGYTLALLGEHPRVMATVGSDFEEQRNWLESHGVDTSAIRTIPDLLTASFFVTTDRANAQIASFFPGAMARASELSLKDLTPSPEVVVISPNDPVAMSAYAKQAGELDCQIIYDPSQQIVRLDAEDIRAGIEAADALFCNDYEYGLIMEKTGLTIESILTSTDFVVITRGEQGATVDTPESQIHTPIIPPERVADPTGVGDAFRGGFLKGYLHQLNFSLCTQMGALAATYCLEQDGPQGHHFTWKAFVDRFRQHFDDDGVLDTLTDSSRTNAPPP